VPGSARLFGTDGMRGAFGHPPLERRVVEQVAYELVRSIAENGHDNPVVIAGGDTRESTDEIARWVASGVREAGGTLRWAGVIPTPGVAWLVRQLAADAGVVISASHNPHPDNGVKILSAEGIKLHDDRERELEARVAASAHPATSALDADGVGCDASLLEAYAEHLVSRLVGDRTGSGPPSKPFTGLRVGLDAGNGAATPLAAVLFRRLGATVCAIGDQPDGRNVNAHCGSTAPEQIARLVLEHGLHLGFAFDGDADRVIASDEQGTVRDGDDLLLLWARHLRGAGLLEPPSIVATSMSNLGLDRALGAEGITVVRCDVGDRQVVETLRARGLLLGGEPSGHLVHLGLATTGDGLLTALEVASIVWRSSELSGEPASRLFSGFERFPQLLRNVRVRAKPPLSSVSGLGELVADVERRLGGEGRLVLRYSGTEPLVRIMIEAREAAQVHALSQELAAFLEARLGLETAVV
jgi:phosphoglucosamine mutase